MSTDDPISLLTHPDEPVAPSPAFADALLQQLLGELERPARPGQPRRRAVRALLVAAALLLLVASFATAAYLLTRPGSARVQPKPGVLTLIGSGSNDQAKIVEVLPNGRLAVVWRCPARAAFCGELESVAWSPDGRHVAFTLDEIGGTSGYIGLHIVDTRTGRDVHIPNLPLAHPTAPQPGATLAALLRKEGSRLGCYFPSQLAWSPDGKRLAYSCSRDFGEKYDRWREIFTIRSNGTGRRRLRTGTRLAFWPSWSPDGTRIAFATGPVPSKSSVYVIGADGTHRRVIARGGTAPDWAPDGHAIAYEAQHEVRLVSPTGVDLSPVGADGLRRVLPSPALPSWSPDSSELAIATNRGVTLVDATTWDYVLVTPHSGLSASAGRPAWYPGSAPPISKGTRWEATSCRTCL